MKKRGKTIATVGFIFFAFQLANFFSVNSITPEFQRAQVLAALSSVTIILIGFLFERFNPESGEKIDLAGENKFLYSQNIPQEILEEIGWGSETILTSTAAASILIHNNGKNILHRGMVTENKFKPGDTCKRCMKDMKLISLANTKFYPGKEEFYSFCLNIPSILIIPINERSFILVGGWSSRCFTKSDEKWINNWSKKLFKLFKKFDY